MITVGDIEIHLINECRILADPGGMFGLVPRVLWERHIKADEDYQIIVDHVVLLVKAGGKTLIVDTGYGTKLDEKRIRQLNLTRSEGTLTESIQRVGNISAEDVDIVINTHFHGDHCGGNTYFDGDEIKATFPKARYIGQRRDFADAMFPNERTRGTYFRENFAPLYDSGQLELVDGEVDVVPGVRGVITPGHTPALMSVVFESNGEYALFCGDMASMSPHFVNLAWMTAFDEEPIVTLETKRYWQQWALDTNALLFFQHDSVIRAGRLVKNEKGRLEIDAVIRAV